MDIIKLVQLLTALVEVLKKHNIKPLDLLAALSELEPTIKGAGIKISPEIDAALSLLGVLGS